MLTTYIVIPLVSTGDQNDAENGSPFAKSKSPEAELSSASLNTIRNRHGPTWRRLTISTNTMTPFQTNPHQPPCARDGRRALTAEDGILNTWRSAFKPVY